MNEYCAKRRCADCRLSGEIVNGYRKCARSYGILSQEQVDFIASYKPPVDWTKVKADSKVIVWNNVGMEHRRYFAKYENGKIYTYLNGATSWSKESDNLVKWQYGRLAEDGEE
ncbi:MAG: hypothetical protein MJZ85_06675 [Bacteroidales bacterium]|nr:hypothetical protein [Bacteroidales bacterium]